MQIKSLEAMITNKMAGVKFSLKEIEKYFKLTEEIKEQIQKKPQQSNIGLSKNDIRDIVRETVEDVLKENGLLVESESRSSDLFKFRVGQHLFEGKVLNVKKMSK